MEAAGSVRRPDDVHKTTVTAVKTSNLTGIQVLWKQIIMRGGFKGTRNDMVLYLLVASHKQTGNVLPQDMNIQPQDCESFRPQIIFAFVKYIEKVVIRFLIIFLSHWYKIFVVLSEVVHNEGLLAF